MGARMYYDPLVGNQIAVKTAFYLSGGDCGVSLETSTRGDLQVAALMQACFEIARDNKPIAEADLRRYRHASAD